MPQSVIDDKSTLIQTDGIKPLPDAMLVEIYVAIWRQ